MLPFRNAPWLAMVARASNETDCSLTFQEAFDDEIVDAHTEFLKERK